MGLLALDGDSIEQAGEDLSLTSLATLERNPHALEFGAIKLSNGVNTSCLEPPDHHL